MVSIKYCVLRSDNFHSAMVKIIQCPMSAEDSSKVLALAKVLEGAVADTQKEWVEMIKPHCHTDGGLFRLNDDKTDFAWLDGVDVAAMKARIVEFANKDVVLEGQEKLELPIDIKLSPAELASLEHIISIKTPS